MSTATRCISLVAVMTVASTAPAYAYLDPGTGSILLQAIVGDVAASLFIARGYIYRLKGWLGLMPTAAEQNRRPGNE